MRYFIILLIIVLVYLIYDAIPSLWFKIMYKIKRKENGKIIYLTFDDGPSTYTNKLLDVLKKYDIKASFFCVASYALENKKIIKRIKREGHVICLHSLNHENAYLMDIFKTNKDFKNSLEIMKNLIS